MPTKQQIQRDETVLAVVERLGRKDLSEKSKKLKSLVAKCRQIYRYLTHVDFKIGTGIISKEYTGDVWKIEAGLSHLAQALNFEIAMLTKIDEARINKQSLTKKNRDDIIDGIIDWNAQEHAQIDHLQRMFGSFFGIEVMKVEKQGRALKSEIKTLLAEYEFVSNRSFKRTYALLQKLI